MSQVTQAEQRYRARLEAEQQARWPEYLALARAVVSDLAAEQRRALDQAVRQSVESTFRRSGLTPERVRLDLPAVLARAHQAHRERLAQLAWYELVLQVLAELEADVVTPAHRR